MENKAKFEIIRCIQVNSGKWSVHQLFHDWVTCLAIAIQNRCCRKHDTVWQAREQQFHNIMSNYTESEQDIFAEMTAFLELAMEEEIADILGEVYMESNGGNKFAGQFFTPFSLSLLDAKLAIPADYGGKEILHLHEPSCGAGGKILAVASVLHDRNINYQRRMRVVAQDLDWLAVSMTYVQLSLYGIDAVVAQGDTLTEPYHQSSPYPPERVMRTPKNMGVLI